MPNKFFLVITKNSKDKQWILNNGPFFMGGRGLYIRDWKLNFNPIKSPQEEVPIWLRIYNLSREYWNEETFQMIGNKLGFYIKSNEAIEKKYFSTYARICIGWKPHSHLPAWLEINTSVGCWVQQIKVEDKLEKIIMCGKEGHSIVCMIGPKGKTVVSSLEAIVA